MNRNNLIATVFLFLTFPSLINFASADEKIDLKKIKQEQGPQIQVVQNRAFTKSGRVEFGLFGGSVMTDPFITVYSVGAKLGYNFNEFYALKIFGWKDFSSDSSSEKKFRTTNGYGTNTNKPNSIYGAEFLWTPIYGKLNLLNSSILYYNLHMGPGLGLRNTESGSNIAYLINLGQDLFISQHFMFQLDYHLLMFNQKILEKVNAPLGVEIGKNFEMSHVFTFGVGYLF